MNLGLTMHLWSSRPLTSTTPVPTALTFTFTSPCSAYLNLMSMKHMRHGCVPENTVLSADFILLRLLCTGYSRAEM